MEMFKNTYRIIVATQESSKDFWEKTPFGKTCSFTKGEHNIHFDLVFKNKTGLSTLYNQKIKQYPEEKLIFMHDDVEVHDKFFFEKLDVAFTMYDIVGLAGAKQAEVKSPAMWHLMCPRNALSGFVSHYVGPNTWNSSYFGTSPSRVLLLDGLFLAVDAKKLIDNDVYFDEDFDFHFYDLAFCFRANEKKLLMGTYPIFVVHHGLGEPDKNWAELETKFIKRYGK